MTRPIKEFGHSFGARVKAERIEQNLSLTSLAYLAGISSTLLYEIERSATDPTLGKAMAVASALNLDLGYFLEEKKPKIWRPMGECRNNVRVLFHDGENIHAGRKFNKRCSVQQNVGGATISFDVEPKAWMPIPAMDE